MCRSIHTLYHLVPPASQAEIRAAARQYVHKISGYTSPSQTNQAAFIAAIDEVEAASTKLIASLRTNSPMRERTAIAGSRN